MIYVPTFNESGDQRALDIYRAAGFKKVVGINTETLSNEGLGSIHCITMTYPPGPIHALIKKIGAIDPDIL